ETSISHSPHYPPHPPLPHHPPPLFPYTTLFRSLSRSIHDRATIASAVFVRSSATSTTLRWGLWSTQSSRSQCGAAALSWFTRARSEEHTSELQSPDHLVCRTLLQQKSPTSNAIP